MSHVGAGAADKFDSYFILPPLGGSIKFLQDYIEACEQNQEKFTMTFEYVWIFMDSVATTNNSV